MSKFVHVRSEGSPEREDISEKKNREILAIHRKKATHSSVWIDRKSDWERTRSGNLVPRAFPLTSENEAGEWRKGGWFGGGLESSRLTPIFFLSDITYRHRNSSHLTIDGVFNHLLAHGWRNLLSNRHYTFLCDTGALDNDRRYINRQEKSRKNRKDFKVN